ncbi:MAG: hydrogenase maturation protease [Pseudomonadota bacterium]|nr:MAG: peptidase M52 [Pseudomonadota bacterium]
MSVLVAGVGNVFRGDDGFGPEVVRKLSGRVLPAGTRVEDFGIRGIHLAYELLEPIDLLIVVDAVSRDGKPGTLYLIEAETEGEIASAGLHGMDLPSVFAFVRGMGGRVPRTYVVGCQPADLSERMGLSPAVRAAVEPATSWVCEIAWKEGGRPPPNVEGR